MTTLLATIVGASTEPCCAPLVREPLSAAEAEQLAVTIKALADPTRLRLLSIVAASEAARRAYATSLSRLA